MGGLGRDRADDLLATHSRVHELLAGEAPLATVLDALVRGIERQSDGLLGSVLLLDAPTRSLHHGSAPHLPQAYREAIDGTVIGPDVGSCGTAAHFGREVIVGDVSRDPRWRDFRDLAAEHGLGACWSVPVLDARGDVLGTFALYYPEPRLPTPAELRLIRQASRLAAISIERHRAHAELKRLATRDALTGLPNRALLVDRLTQALARSRRTGSEVAVVFCDIDSFQLINDSMGHEMGDWMLREVAQRLAGTIRPGDTVARFGGDEFVVVADGVAANCASSLAARIHAAFAAPLVHPDSGEHSVSVSLGIAVAGSGSSPADAIRRADSALSDAKRRGVETRVYTRDMRRRATEQLHLHGELRRALEHEELRMAYQPIVEVESGEVVAFEALMRWDNQRLGSVSPACFIPAAEMTGLIIELGDWALETAVTQAQAWERNGEPLAMAVNLSTRQLVDPGLPRRIARILAAADFAPARLVAEVTETSLIDTDLRAMETLREISALGVHVVLDDFGTGYSSFSRLRRLPIEALKIDREFVAGLGVDRDARAIVRAMIGVAQGLGLAVTAEGVETDEQRALLTELGATHLQGYLLGRPGTAAEAARLLTVRCAAQPG